MSNTLSTTNKPGVSSEDVAKRAHTELGAAMVALQHAGALFRAIEKAYLEGDKDGPFLLAQIGQETTAYQAERCDGECDFFDEVSHA